MKFDAAQIANYKADRKGAILGDMLVKQLGLKLGDKFTLTGTIYPGDWEFTVDAIYTALVADLRSRRDEAMSPMTLGPSTEAIRDPRMDSQ